MTTETTTTVTEKTDAEIFADDILTVKDGLEETKRNLVRLYDQHQSQRARIDQLDSAMWTQRNSKEDIIKTIKDFIVEHVKDNEDADVDELKELAEELEIELTKKVTISFHVDYEIEIDCALDYEVDESDFRVSLDYNGEGEMEVNTEDMLDFESDDNE